MTTDPQDELLTEVDQNNQVIGPIPRGQAHQSGVYYRTIYVLVVDEKNRILLQKRSPTKDLYPNKWDLSVGGHVNYGDSYLETAVRELEEELGIRTAPSDLKFLKEILVTLPNSQEFFHVFEYHLRDNDNIKPSREEVAGIKWLSQKDLINDLQKHPTNWYERPVQVLNSLF